MKTKKMNLKTIVLSLGLIAMMLPASAMAQRTAERPGGVFGPNDQSGTSLLNRTEKEGLDLNVEIQTFQDPAPLGSGIVILIGAGLGYVALKKKEDEQ